MRHPVPLTAARLGALALGMAGLAVSAPMALGDTKAPLYAKMEQRFTTQKPGASTGWKFDGALKPYPLGVQPPPQRSATFVFPRGTRFDLTGVPTCAASDERIARLGPNACPKRSRVGSGEASLFVGRAGIIKAYPLLFATRRGFAVPFPTDTGVPFVVRATVNRNRVTVVFPAIEVLGGYELSLTGMSLRVARFGTRKHPGLRTPARCPKSGRWTFTYLPRYDQPYGVQRSTSSVRCSRRTAK
jgi:hypothetical protein